MTLSEPLRSIRTLARFGGLISKRLFGHHFVEQKFLRILNFLKSSVPDPPEAAAHVSQRTAVMAHEQA